MNVRFYLHSKSDRLGWNFIYCQYTHSSEKWRFSTGFKIHPQYWSKKRGIPKSSYPNGRIIAQSLENIQSEVYEIAYTIRAKGGMPTPELIKEHWIKRKQRISVEAAWEMFYEQHLSSLAHNTKKRFKTTRNNLLALNPNWQDFSEDWGESFRDHLTELGNIPNTSSKKLSDVKTFLRFCKKKGHINNDIFESWDTPINRKTDQVFLTPEEIRLLEDKTFDLLRFEKTRQLFLFHCYTGLRYGDGQKIEIENINFKKSFLSLQMEKGKKGFKIPIKAKALDILSMYQGLPKISNQKFNQYIKEICKDCGINQKILHKGDMKEKCKCITTHTGRRSFITNSLNAGIPANIVSALVGHADIKTTSRYDQSGFNELRKFVE